MWERSNYWERWEKFRFHLHLEAVCVSSAFSKKRQKTSEVCRGGWKGWWKLWNSKEQLNNQFLRVFKNLAKSKERYFWVFWLAWFGFLARKECKCSLSQANHRSWGCARRKRWSSAWENHPPDPTVRHRLIMRRQVIPCMSTFQLLTNIVMFISKTDNRRTMKCFLPPAWLQSLMQCSYKSHSQWFPLSRFLPPQSKSHSYPWHAILTHHRENCICGFGRLVVTMTCEHQNPGKSLHSCAANFWDCWFGYSLDPIFSLKLIQSWFSDWK